REERNDELIQRISESYVIKERLHFEDSERDDRFLEGTGSMILDRVNKIVYACISPRTNEALLREWCAKTGYEPFVFFARLHGKDIYHTNVIMTIGDGIAVACIAII